jgi:hypothetical protein
MSDILSAKPLPQNHGSIIIELFAVCRTGDTPELVDIAEHSDGAAKMYGNKAAAQSAADILGPGWTVKTVWLLHKGCRDLPPGMAIPAALAKL